MSLPNRTQLYAWSVFLFVLADCLFLAAVIREVEPLMAALFSVLWVLALPVVVPLIQAKDAD